MQNKYILLFLFGFFGIQHKPFPKQKYSMKKDNTNRQSPFLRNL